MPHDIDDVFEAACERLLAAHPDDDRGRMLSAMGIRVGGQAYGFVGRHALICKLPRSRVEALIASGEGAPCATSPGRVMREWVQLRLADVDHCVVVLEEARTFVASQLDQSR